MKSFLLRALAVLSAILIMRVSAYADDCEHSYDGGEVTTAPTCDTIGIITYTCTLCGEQTTAKLGNLGHCYDENGVCERCHLDENGEYIEPVQTASPSTAVTEETPKTVVLASATVPTISAVSELPVELAHTQQELRSGSDGSARLLLFCLAGSFFFVFSVSGLLSSRKKHHRYAMHASAK